MENSFIHDLWAKWKFDCAVIVYGPFLPKCMTAEENSLDFGDVTALSYYACEEELLLKEMLNAFEVAETMEEGHRQVQMTSLKEWFQYIQSRSADELVSCFGDSSSLLFGPDSINLDKMILQYGAFIRNNDIPFPSVASALSAPLLHLRLRYFLAERVRDGFFHPNNLLDGYLSDAATSLLSQGEELLLCADDEDREKIKEIYVEAMKFEMQAFVIRDETVLDWVEIPLSKCKAYKDIHTGEVSFSFDQPVEIIFSATSALLCSSGVLSDTSLVNDAYEEGINKALLTPTSTSFDYSSLSQVVDQIVSVRESVSHCNLDDLEQNLQYGFRRFIQNGLQMGLSLYIKVHESWLLDQIRPTISAWGVESVSGLEDLGRIKVVAKQGAKLVYIGDSVTDLLYLLEADIGIVIGEQAHLREVGTHFGVKFVPLLKWLTGEREAYFEHWGPKTGRLFTVDSWVDIHAFVIGYHGIVDYLRYRLK